MPRRKLDCFLPMDTRISGRKSFEPPQCGVKQTKAPAKRPALDVVVSRRKLDQPLEKLARLTLRNEPMDLPGFMSVPELVRVEEVDARDEG
jgi:hypothetical protein